MYIKNRSHAFYFLNQNIRTNYLKQLLILHQKGINSQNEKNTQLQLEIYS
jgi:hypothetical protein